MTKMRWPAIVLLLCVSGTFLHARDNADCWAGSKAAIRKQFSVFLLRLTPLSNSVSRRTGEGCLARIVSTQEKTVFSAADWAFSIIVDGQDIDGDGLPDLVLEGDSGGMHGTSTYYVFSLAETPRLTIKFQTDAVPAHFIPSPKGKTMDIQTWDGAFFMFDGAPTAGSPYPLVYLRIVGKRLIDISQEHLADYDKAIAQLKAEIPAKDLNVFLQAETADEKIGWEHVSDNVLKMVVAYLYSGRQAEAHRTLRRMWPAFDQERVWELILEARRKGILRYTAHNRA